MKVRTKSATLTKIAEAQATFKAARESFKTSMEELRKARAAELGAAKEAITAMAKERSAKSLQRLEKAKATEAERAAKRAATIAKLEARLAAERSKAIVVGVKAKRAARKPSKVIVTKG